MPGFVLHVSMTATCPHQGPVTVAAATPKVFVGGLPVATLQDQYMVAGCAFTVPGPKPQPCVSVRWTTPATKVFAGGSPVLLQSSSGYCESAERIPQGPPLVTAVQTRVTGT